jgi:5-dehydro-2-deoxygluconokinase
LTALLTICLHDRVTDPFEVLTMGRIGVDIYPLQVGVRLEDVTSFGKYLGGSAANVAVAASRLGRRSAVITRTGEDPFGRFLHKALNGYGVDDRYVTSVPSLPTPVTFCEIFPPDDFPIYFYRYPKAPDLELAPAELDMPAVVAAGVFWVTVTGLSQEPSRSATLAALAERARSGITVLDLDYRPTLWSSREEARRWARAALPATSMNARPRPEPGIRRRRGGRYASWAWTSRWSSKGRPVCWRSTTAALSTSRRSASRS